MIDVMDTEDSNPASITPDMVATARKVSILRLLPKGTRMRPTGLDRYMIRCPFHNDNTPSLSVWKAEDGTWCFNCFAGCGKGDVITFVQKAEDMDFTDAVKALWKATQEVQSDTVMKQAYSYYDESGVMLYQVVRYDSNGLKSFRQRVPLGDGHWCWSLGGVRRVLYQTPLLVNLKPHDLVFYVEGEKDVHTLLSLGLVATTHCGGAGAFRPEYASQLWGTSVVLLPDADPPGAKMAKQVAEALLPVVLRLGWIDLPVGQGKDVTEYVDGGGDVVELLGSIRWIKTEET